MISLTKKNEELKQKPTDAELRKANEYWFLGSLKMARNQQQQATALLNTIERHLEAVEIDHDEEPPGQSEFHSRIILQSVKPGKSYETGGSC
jgi:calcineurin-like phosphoesterase family protein